VESIFSVSPKASFALKGYYASLSPILRLYPPYSSYLISSNELFFTSMFDRNIYRISIPTLEVKDSIVVIPESYTVPQGCEVKKETLGHAPEIIDRELKQASYVANILYNKAEKRYYVFVKTGVDKSQTDELGYPFKVFVYDGGFNKKKEVDFPTDEYNPKSAMLTSRGVMIEKTEEKYEYGKKTFVFFNW
jgi:hypothetical protein